jgi:hypothetical protein
MPFCKIEQRFPADTTEQSFEESRKAFFCLENMRDDCICYDVISDFVLEQAKFCYGCRVVKENIFYYVYGNYIKASTAKFLPATSQL